MDELTVQATAPPALPERPLPIGAFPLPFGYLLLPATAEDEPVRRDLLAGRLPRRWPAALRGHQLALAGDHDQALAAFAGTDPVSRFNRFVVDPDSVDPDSVRAGLGAELGPLVDLVEFALGRTDCPPEAHPLDGELAALALAAQAALALSAAEAGSAVGLLERALAAAAPVSTALAGVLHGALASACRQAGDVAAAQAQLRLGIAALAQTDLVVALAEQHLELASTYHEQAGERRDLLAKAVHHYHCALQTVTEEQAGEVFAAAHANLAAAYLTMPMVEASDQLRLGVALGSLRAALRVYTPQTHPRQWSSAQLNLANALVYAPSTHQADNLLEAVALYEEVLAARSRDLDPLGYARVLANQGNALAHLGLFEQARGKLVEARFVFEELHDYEAVTSVRGVLDEIARRVAVAAPQAG